MCADESKPPVFCHLTSGLERCSKYLGDINFKDEDILASEVWTILNQSLVRMEHEGNLHRIIPVCLSALGRDIPALGTGDYPEHVRY